MKKLTKILFVIFGSLSLGLGAVGVFVPILPTTPFLLLSAFCYLRGSSRLHSWLLSHKIFGPYIYNYIKYKAVTRKTKIFSIILLWLSLSVSALLIEMLHVRLLLLAVGLGVTIHLLTLKTIPSNTGTAGMENNADTILGESADNENIQKNGSL